jgi:hypothetical protein
MLQIRGQLAAAAWFWGVLSGSCRGLQLGSLSFKERKLKFSSALKYIDSYDILLTNPDSCDYRLKKIKNLTAESGTFEPRSLSISLNSTNNIESIFSRCYILLLQ